MPTGLYIMTVIDITPHPSVSTNKSSAFAQYIMTCYSWVIGYSYDTVPIGSCILTDHLPSRYEKDPFLAIFVSFISQKAIDLYVRMSTNVLQIFLTLYI